MDHLRQLSARYNAVWHEARVWLRLEVDRAEQLIEYTALYNRYFREVGD